MSDGTSSKQGRPDLGDGESVGKDAHLKNVNGNGGSLASDGVTLSGMEGVDLEAAPSLVSIQSRDFYEVGGGKLSAEDSFNFQKTVVPGLIDKQRYKITGEFARGGMGRILLAYDRSTGREVAIKELIGSQHEADPDPEGGRLGATGPTMQAGPSMVAGRGVPGSPQLSESPPPDEITVERFLREAKITSRLEHPNIVPVYEIAQRKDGVWYYTMKFVRGVTLSKRLREISRNNELDDKAKLAERIKLLGVFIDVCNAVAFAHSKGVVHRDLKPDNIMVGEFGETIVLDWGLARVEGEDSKKVTHILSTKSLRSSGQRKKKKADESDSSTSARLTMMGSVVGTPSYMPPEQALGKLEEVDEASDTYALGTILYELLSGTRAYPGDDAYDILDAVLAGPPPALTSIAPDVPPELAAVATKAMAREKRARFQKASSLAAEIRAWRDGRAVASYKYSTGEQVKRIVKRHRAVVMTGAAALLLLLIGATFALISINAEKNEAENARGHAVEAQVTAESANRELLAEKQAREKLEAEVADRWRTARERVKGEYLAGVAKLAASKSLEARQSEGELLYKAWLESGKREPAAEIRHFHEQAMLSINEAVGNLEQLLAKATTPIEGRPPLLFAQDNPEGDAALVNMERDKLNAAKLVSVRLCTANGDYALARYLLGWAASTGLDQARLGAEFGEIAAAQGSLMSRRRARIEYALEDAARGFGRSDRAKEAPLLDDYVFELVGYRDEQTVKMLGARLLEHAKKAGWDESFANLATNPSDVESDQGPRSPGKLPVARDVTWTQPERDVVTLCCRVLGRLGLGEEVVKALTPISTVVIDHELAVECAAAFGATQNYEAWKPLSDMHWRIGGSTGTGRAISESFRTLPLKDLGPTPEFSLIRRRGNAYMLTGDWEAAIVWLTRAIDLCENDPKTLSALLTSRGTAYVMGKRYASALEDLNRAIDIDSTNDSAYNSRGIARAGTGDYQGAIDDYNTTIALDGKATANLLTNRANALWFLGRRDEAMADISDAIAEDPQHASARCKRAEFRNALLDFEGAIEDANRAIALEPQNAWAHVLRGQAKFGLEDGAGAIEDLSRALSLDPKSSNAYYSRAAARRSAGDFQGALEDIEAGAAIDGNTRVTRRNRAQSLEAMGRIADALAEWNGLIEKNDEDVADDYLSRGLFHIRQKNLELGKRDCDKALELDPNSVTILTDRSVLHTATKNYAQTVEECTRALELRPGNMAGLNSRASAYKALGETAKALLDYSEMLAINPRSYAALNNRALIYIDEGRLDDAIADYTRTIEIKPRSPFPWGNRARAYERRKEFSKAKSDFSRAIDLDRSNSIRWFNRGVFFYIQLDYASAESDFLKSLSLVQQSLGSQTQSLNGLGLVYHATRRYQEAIEVFTKVLESDTSYSDFYSNRAKTWLALKKFPEGIADLTKAIELCVNPEDGAAKSGYLIRRAECKGRSKDRDGMMADYEAAIALDPEDLTAVNNIAASMIDSREYQRSLELIDRGISISTERNVTTARLHYNRARVMTDTANHVEALKSVNTSIELDPEYARAYGLRARAKNNTGDFKGAIFDAEEFHRRDPQDSGAFFYLGFAKRKLKNIDGALEDFTKAIDMDEGLHPGARLERAQIYLDQGRYRDGIKDCDAVIAQGDFWPKAYFWRGACYAQLNDLPQAVKDMGKCVELDPKDSLALFNLGRFKIQVYDFEGANKDFDAYQLMEPKDHRVLLERGIAKFNSKDLEGSIKDLSEFLVAKPDDSDAHRIRSIALEMAGKPRESLIDARWCFDAKLGDWLTNWSKDQVAKLERTIALEPWLTKTPTTPDESILKARAILGFSHTYTGAAAASELSTLVEPIFNTWKDVPKSDPRWRDVAEISEKLGQRFHTLKQYAASFAWFTRAHDNNQWLADRHGAAYNAACSAALEANRLAALEATPASPGTEPKKPAAANSPESSKYWIEQALAYLTIAADNGYPQWAHASKDADLTPLRADPRFAAIIERMKANDAKQQQDAAKGK